MLVFILTLLKNVKFANTRFTANDDHIMLSAVYPILIVKTSLKTVSNEKKMQLDVGSEPPFRHVFTKDTYTNSWMCELLVVKFHDPMANTS